MVSSDDVVRCLTNKFLSLCCAEVVEAAAVVILVSLVLVVVVVVTAVELAVADSPSNDAVKDDDWLEDDPVFTRLLVPCGGFGNIGDADGCGIFNDLQQQHKHKLQT